MSVCYCIASCGHVAFGVLFFEIMIKWFIKLSFPLINQDSSIICIPIIFAFHILCFVLKNERHPLVSWFSILIWILEWIVDEAKLSGWGGGIIEGNVGTVELWCTNLGKKDKELKWVFGYIGGIYVESKAIFTDENYKKHYNWWGYNTTLIGLKFNFNKCLSANNPWKICQKFLYT